MDENLEDLTKHCQTGLESVKESMWHYSGCTRKEKVKVKVKLSHHRPGQAQRVPGI
jgi:hypothetical protein